MSDYGSVAGVATLTRKYTDSGSYTDSTRPTTTEVDSLLDQVCSAINLYLSTEGFETPITDTDIVPALDGLANTYAVDLVHASHSAGRFFTDEKLQGKAPFTVISKEIADWIASQASGFKKLGATRSMSDARRIGSLKTDRQGNDVAPLFQLGDFGNDLPTD